ncbi:MAG: nucleotidyltransferase family protein [Deltaproteobacteria bacterium]|nr:nucleotidyltransferase family protein [Deltaproteobacteria bacterium]
MEKILQQCLKGETFTQDSNPVSWDHLAPLLKREGWLWLFYGWARQNPEMGKKIPDDFLLILRQNYYTVASRNALQREGTRRVLRALHTARIPVLLHKGIFLMEDLYADIGIRAMTDVDLLVPQEFLGAAEMQLRRLGFRQEGSGECWSDPIVLVDLHTDLNNTRRFHRLHPNPDRRIRKMWQQAQPYLFEGIPVLVLSMEDQLIALCFHLAFNHHLQGPLWLADIHRFLKKYKNRIDWEKISLLAREYEQTKSVFYSLKYLKENWQTPVPEDILEKLRPTTQQIMEKWIVRRIWKEKRVGRLGYFLSLSLIENAALQRRCLWLTFKNLFFK